MSGLRQFQSRKPQAMNVLATIDDSSTAIVLQTMIDDNDFGSDAIDAIEKI